MSAIASLRAATWPSHQRLEKRLDIKARFTRLDAYRAHLAQMWGFCAGLERQLESGAFGCALADYESRRKLPLLTRDLIALGATVESVASLERCSGIPECADTAEAFGCLYVLEGATLGGRTLLPLVHSHLGLDAGHGAAFLASYGENVSQMWSGFGVALDAWCSDATRQARAAAGAVATFGALEGWLCGSAP